MAGYVGLLLELKKRKWYLGEDDTKDFDYLLFGNFDGVKIRKSEKWGDFIPSAEMDLRAAGYDIEEDTSGDFSKKIKGLSVQNEKHISTFILKLLKPDVELNNFEYDIWINGEFCESGTPYFAMFMMNVSSEAASYYSKKGYAELFNEICSAVSENCEGIKCGVFESLGYYDFVVLAESDSPKKFIGFSEKIKEATFDESVQNIFSSCYLVSGIKNCLVKNGELDLSEINVNQFEETLNKASSDISDITVSFQLNHRNKLQNLQEKFKASDVEISKILLSEGDSDISLLFDGDNKAKIFRQYFSGGLFNPESLYEKKILTMKTRLYFENELIPVQGDKEEDDFFYQIDEELLEHFKDYMILLDKKKRIQRRATALKNLIRIYNNIAKCNHSFEIRALIKPVFESLLKNMKKANSFIEMNDGYWSEYDEIDFWSAYDIALDSFRENVGGFLSDLALSDKYFIEDSMLKHPPIGSATKLIFFYNSVVNQIVREIIGDVGDDVSTYSFLVKSGGGDQVVVINLFDFLPPYDLKDNKQHQEDCLLIIEIPERLLYNIPVTLFAVFHEIFHIVGERKRKFRSEKTIEAISEYTAKTIITYGTLFSRLIKCGEDSSNKLKKLLEQKLKQRIKKEIPDYNNEKELKYYSRDFYRIIKSAIDEEYKSYLDGDVESLKDIVKILLEEEYQIIEILISAKSKDRFFLKSIELYKYSASVEYYKEYSNEEFCRSLSVLFNLIVGNPLSDKEKNKMEGGQQNVISNIYTFNDIVDDLQTVMNEGFSDCMAIKALGIKPEEYFINRSLLIEGEEKALFPINTSTILRLGCVFGTVFKEAVNFDNESNPLKCKPIENDSTELNEEVSRRLREKMEKISGAGMFAKTPDIDKIIERINYILKIYNRTYRIYWKNYGINEVILEYLEECVTLNEKLCEKIGKSIIGDKGVEEFNRNIVKEVMQYWLELSAKTDEECCIA